MKHFKQHVHLLVVNIRNSLSINAIICRPEIHSGSGNGLQGNGLQASAGVRAVEEFRNWTKGYARQKSISFCKPTIENVCKANSL